MRLKPVIALVAGLATQGSVIVARQQQDAWSLVKTDLAAKSEATVSSVSPGLFPAIGAVSFHNNEFIALRSYDRHLEFIIVEVKTGRLVGTVKWEGSRSLVLVPSGDDLVIAMVMADSTVRYTQVSVIVQARPRLSLKRIDESEAVSRELALREAWHSAIEKSGMAIGLVQQSGGNGDANDAFGPFGAGKYAAFSQDGKYCAALVRESGKLTDELELKLFESQDPTMGAISYLRSAEVKSKEVERVLIDGEWLLLQYKSGKCEVRPLAQIDRVHWTFDSGCLVRTMSAMGSTAVPTGLR